MATTVSIPLTVLSVGTHDFGPAAVADTDTQAVLTVDRTVSKGNVQGFNNQPSTTTADIQIYQSNDGGATWQLLIDGLMVGGTFNNAKTGQVATTSSVTIDFNPGTSRQAKASIVVSGASVAVSGSLTTS
jgi:hypothetical protein